MSLLWVAKQLPPRLNNQQLPPVSARVKGCAGLPGGHGASAVRSPPSGLSPPPHSPPMLPWAPAGKAPIPPKSRWKTKVRARCGEEDCGPEGGRQAGDVWPLLPVPATLSLDGRPQRWHGFPPPTPCAFPRGTSTPYPPRARYPVPQFPRESAASTVPAPASASMDGTGESRVGFPTAGGSSAPRSLFILLSFFCVLFCFFPTSSVANCFLAPGPTCK